MSIVKQCSKCKETKPERDFWFDKSKGRHIAHCLTCQSEGRRAWKERNADKVKADHKRWVDENRDRVKAAQERWKSQNPGLAKERARAWYHANKDKANGREQARYAELKAQVYAAYGGQVCACCGETEPRFLTVDHIDNNGADHRREMDATNSGGKKIYFWLRDNGFPPGFQILCMNCNWGKARNNGVCPHKDTEGSTTIPKGSTAKRPEVRSPRTNTSR